MIFVYADWLAQESWLTAHAAGDEVMLGELHASLTGGPKIHALSAALFYEIDPADAKSHLVELQGRRVPAYTAGKRISHLRNYGGGAGKIAQVFWLPRAFAEAACAKHDAKYAATAAWRERLANEVFGVGEWRCPRACGMTSIVGGTCPACSRRGMPVPLKWVAWAARPTRELRTAFGRRRLYEGKREECVNAVAAQRPQSGGASCWLRTLQRLAGFEVRRGERVTWPVPGVRYRVVTGTYDSFLIECYEKDATHVLRWLLWTMEQPWPQLDGLRLPAEGAIGHNYGAWSKVNPRGLHEYKDHMPFAEQGPDAVSYLEIRAAVADGLRG